MARIQSATGKEITYLIILEGAENFEIPAPLLIWAQTGLCFNGGIYRTIASPADELH
jgi:hypothetical protein